MSLYWI